MRRLLLALMFSPAAAGYAQEEPARPEDWRDLAIQSDVVATVTVTEPRIRVIRPEKNVYRTVQAADGRKMIIFPQPSEYLEGLLVRVRILDALGIEKYGTWSGISGTTLEYPGDIDRKGEKFNVASAYGPTLPELWRGARSLLSYTKEPEETLALAIREAKVVAGRPPPLVALTAPKPGYVRGMVALAGEVSDDLEIGSAQVTADGQALDPSPRRRSPWPGTRRAWSTGPTS